MRWRRLLVPLRYLVSGGLLLYLIWHANPQAIWPLLHSADLGLVLVALLLQFAGVALSAAKWGLLLRARGQRQPYLWLLGSYLAGQFANNFLPTTVGGDALRVTQLGRRLGSYSQASASVFVERLTGFLALSLIATLALLLCDLGWSPQSISTRLPLQVLVVAFTMLAIATLVSSSMATRLQSWLAILPAALQRPLLRFSAALVEYAPRGGMLGMVLGLSFLFQSLWIAVHIACGLALHLQGVPLLMYVLMVTITDIVGLAPLFFNNLGAREGIFILYLAQIQIAQPVAIALALLVFSVRLVVSILGGLVVLFGGTGLGTWSEPQSMLSSDT